MPQPTTPPRPGVLSPEGAAEARAWIADSLDTVEDALHIEIVRERAWGDIWRIDAGTRHWFKAPYLGLAREVPLRTILQARAPQAVLPLVAAHPDRGWQLTGDAGPTLAALTRNADREPLTDVGPRLYADLARALAQIQRAVTVDDLAGLGFPEFDPMHAVETFEREVTPFRELPADHPAHCSAEEAHRTAQRLTDLVQRWESGGGAGLPLGVDHNDAHAGNAFLCGGRVLVSDWGDAVIGLPFASLRALLVPLRNTFGREALPLVRRAYLEEYSETSLPMEQLEELLDLAMMLAVSNRLRCWGALRDQDVWAEYADWITPLWSEAGTPVTEVSAP